MLQVCYQGNLYQYNPYKSNRKAYVQAELHTVFFWTLHQAIWKKKKMNNIECQADSRSPSSIIITRRVLVNVIVQDYLYSPFTVKFVRISLIGSSTLQSPDVKKVLRVSWTKMKVALTSFCICYSGFFADIEWKPKEKHYHGPSSRILKQKVD